MVKIIVPASSANLGPGFDSLGLAVDLYLTVELLAGEPKVWEVVHELGPDIPSDERNLIVQAALALDETLMPRKIKVTSEIPLARGLGSSSAAIVAGVKLAQYLSTKEFTEADLLAVATKLEGHPDNVAPALLGNLTISLMLANEPKTLQTKFPPLSLLAYIPDFELETKTSRSVLPTEMSYAEAVLAGSVGNALVAALYQGDLALIAHLLEADSYHEPYRQKLVPHLLTLRELGHELGANGTYLSGAGPTVVTLLEQAKIPLFIEQAKAKGLTDKFVTLHVDEVGAKIID